MPSDQVLPKYTGSLEYLYHDEDIIIVNKPEFFLSVPGKHPGNYDSVQSRIQQDYPEAMCAHRLDLDTSGIMTIALHKEALRRIHRQFQERAVYKEYIAVVYGHPELDEGSIELPLICDWPNRPRQMVCHENGKYALTNYTVLSREENNRSRVLLKPLTGRSHQLRVHLKELGHPILGCDLYAHPEALSMSPRLLLHASLLTIQHPMSGEKMTIQNRPLF